MKNGFAKNNLVQPPWYILVTKRVAIQENNVCFQFTEGGAACTGLRRLQEAVCLCLRLKAGSLPVPWW